MIQSHLILPVTEFDQNEQVFVQPQIQIPKFSFVLENSKK